MVFSLGLRFSAALALEPLPVGETGGSKGKGDGREGDHPFCKAHSAEERGHADGGSRTLPRARGSAL